MPLQATSGAASYDAFGGGVPVVPNYIEEVFSTYLYTGTGTNQTITNGIDLSTKGGLVWTKGRNYAFNHWLIDTVRGNTNIIKSNTTDAASNLSGGGGAITSFNTTGYGVNLYDENNSPAKTFVSWTFRKQPKFFDVVTYSGNSTAGREITHNLGSTPGCIIVKRLNQAEDWIVYHRGISNSLLRLNTTDANASANAKYYWGNNTTFIAPTSTVFTVATDSSINQTGGTYVAYIFAHNAGGFGLTGTDNVISCGSYTGNSSSFTPISLGYEPQWLMIKKTDGAGNWVIFDTTRGMPTFDSSGAAYAQILRPNLSLQETTGNATPYPVSTGFGQHYADSDFSSGNFIYIAIRRGPMKVPTSGTSVYNAIAYTGNDASNRQVTGLGFPPDLALVKARTQVRNYGWEDRLRGADQWLVSSGTDSESSYSGSGAGGPLLQNGITIGANGLTNEAPNPYILQAMRRAPSFFDEVCYTGTGSVQNITHNLTVKPQLIIYKKRSSSTAAWWFVYAEPLGATKNLTLDSNNAEDVYTPTFNDTEPTSTVFTVGTYSGTNASAQTFVAYLFATCAGVSKVGSYTGNGSTQTIDCGFTGGARFVLIKRTDSTGGWYVYDTARGMTVLTDPYLLLNSTDAEVATLGSVTTVATGFALNSTILAAINVSAGTYIFLAIA